MLIRRYLEIRANDENAFGLRRYQRWNGAQQRSVGNHTQRIERRNAMERVGFCSDQPATVDGNKCLAFFGIERGVQRARRDDRDRRSRLL